MKGFKCLVCGSKDSITIASQGQGRLVKCDGCGLLSGFPLPETSEEKLNETYQKEYYQRYHQANQGQKIGANKKPLVADASSHYLVEEIGALNGRKGRLLDVGCGPAWFLWHAQNLGWHAYGLDVARDVIESNKRYHKWGKFYCGTLKTAKLKKDYFDAVVLSHVIEHCPHADQVLAECHRLLRKGGILFVAVPNTDSLHSTFKKFKFKLLGKGTYGSLKPPIHWYDFNQETLSRLVEKSGFEVVKVSFRARHAITPLPGLKPRLVFFLERLLSLDAFYFLENLTGKKSLLQLYARK